jgi:hypothetical protein
MQAGEFLLSQTQTVAETLDVDYWPDPAALDASSVIETADRGDGLLIIEQGLTPGGGLDNILPSATWLQMTRVISQSTRYFPFPTALHTA